MSSGFGTTPLHRFARSEIPTWLLQTQTVECPLIWLSLIFKFLQSCRVDSLPAPILILEKENSTKDLDPASMKEMTVRCLAGRMAMHACQIGPTDTAPPCPGSPLRSCVGTGDDCYDFF